MAFLQFAQITGGQLFQHNPRRIPRAMLRRRRRRNFASLQRLTAIVLCHKYPKRRGKRNILAFVLVDDAEQSALSDFTQIVPELWLKR